MDAHGGQRSREKGSQPCPEKGYRILVRGNEIRPRVFCFTNERGNDRTTSRQRGGQTDFCTEPSCQFTFRERDEPIRRLFADEMLPPRPGNLRLVPKFLRLVLENGIFGEVKVA